jgi:hypothetical protein
MRGSDYILATNIARLQAASALLRQVNGHPSVDGEKIRDAIIATEELLNAAHNAVYAKEPQP